MDDAMKAMADEEPELTEVQFLRVEAEEKPNISMEFQVAAVPTFLFFRNGSHFCTPLSFLTSPFLPFNAVVSIFI